MTRGKTLLLIIAIAVVCAVGGVVTAFYRARTFTARPPAKAAPPPGPGSSLPFSLIAPFLSASQIALAIPGNGSPKRGASTGPERTTGGGMAEGVRQGPAALRTVVRVHPSPLSMLAVSRWAIFVKTAVQKR